MFQSPWPAWIMRQLVARGVDDPRVLAAMAAVNRADFMPPDMAYLAQEDGAWPIGCGQSISQPYVVGLGLQALALRGHEKVLDVGTGSGYQAALLAHLAGRVFTVEWHGPLLVTAQNVLAAHTARLGLPPVECRQGDGALGWPDEAPFDAMVVGAQSPAVPPALAAQLAVGGRLVIPLGPSGAQTLYCLTKRADGAWDKRILERVVFVPLLGPHGTGGG